MYLNVKTPSGISPTAPSMYLPSQSPMGMCVDSTQAQSTSVMADIKAAGCNFVRFDCDWYWMERTQGTIDWSAVDAGVNTVTAAGMKVILVIQTQAQWSSGVAKDTTGCTTAAQQANFAAFCTKVAQRYGHKVAVYEIWNEPNLNMFWTNPDVNAYIATLAAASQAIKAVDPSLYVISAGLGGYGGSPDIDIRTWLPAFFAAHAEQWVDGIGIHDYGNNLTADTVLWSTRQLVAAMKTASVSRPIWITETGCPTAPPGTFSAFSVVENDLATIVSVTRTAFESLSPKGGGFIFYEYADRQTGSTTDREAVFGVLRHSDGTAKPSLSAATSTGALAAMRPVTITQK